MLEVTQNGMELSKKEKKKKAPKKHLKAPKKAPGQGCSIMYQQHGPPLVQVHVNNSSHITARVVAYRWGNPTPNVLVVLQPGQQHVVQAYAGDLVRAVDVQNGWTLAEKTAGQPGPLVIQVAGSQPVMSPSMSSSAAPPVAPNRSAGAVVQNLNRMKSISEDIYKYIYHTNGQSPKQVSDLLHQVEQRVLSSLLELVQLVKSVNVGLNYEEQLLKDRSFHQSLLLSFDSLKEALTAIEQFNLKEEICCWSSNRVYPYIGSAKIQNLVVEIRRLSAGVSGLDLGNVRVDLSQVSSSVTVSGANRVDYDNTSQTYMHRSQLKDEATVPLLAGQAPNISYTLPAPVAPTAPTAPTATFPVEPTSPVSDSKDSYAQPPPEY